MNGTPAPVRAPKRRIRAGALALMSLALFFYFGFIAITYYRSHR